MENSKLDHSVLAEWVSQYLHDNSHLDYYYLLINN